MIPDRLLVELGHMFRVEADMVEDAYAWPPRKADAVRTLEADRLAAIADAIYARVSPTCTLSPDDAFDLVLADFGGAP